MNLYNLFLHKRYDVYTIRMVQKPNFIEHMRIEEGETGLQELNALGKRQGYSYPTYGNH